MASHSDDINMMPGSFKITFLYLLLPEYKGLLHCAKVVIVMLSWLKSSKFKEPKVALGLPSPNCIDLTPEKAKICAAADI